MGWACGGSSPCNSVTMWANIVPALPTQSSAPFRAAHIPCSFMFASSAGGIAAGWLGFGMHGGPISTLKTVLLGRPICLIDTDQEHPQIWLLLDY
mgnify:CR=1 FL=1